MSNEVKYPQAKMKLVGADGNAFAIIGRASRALNKAGLSRTEISAELHELFQAESYEQLLQRVMALVSCDEEE